MFDRVMNTPLAYIPHYLRKSLSKGDNSQMLFFENSSEFQLLFRKLIKFYWDKIKEKPSTTYFKIYL